MAAVGARGDGQGDAPKWLGGPARPRLPRAVVPGSLRLRDRFRIADRTGIPVEVVARVLEAEMDYLIERGIAQADE
jgi:hypothetical protein